MKLYVAGILAKSMFGSMFGVTLMAILSIVCYVNISALQGISSKLEQCRKLREDASAVESGALQLKACLQGYLLTGEQPLLSAYREAERRIDSLLTNMKRTSQEESQGELIQEAQKRFQEWLTDFAHPSVARLTELGATKNAGEIVKEAGKSQERSDRLGIYAVAGGRWKIFDEFRQQVTDFVAKQEAVLADLRRTGNERADITKKIIILLNILLVAVLFTKNYLMSRRTTTDLTEATILAEAISRGDLSRRIVVNRQDEVGRLSEALNRMADILNGWICQIGDGVNVLESSVATMSATASELSSTTALTSSAVIEAFTTVEELKQTAKLASGKAKKVSEGSIQSLKASESGKKATEDTIHRMNLIKEQMESIGETVARLSEHSQAIEDIIKTVQDLADQSNLLAVNASIEAARAGDQGKGFAVVSHEIKTLAGQSKQATQKVRHILEDTRKRVSAVVMATEQASKAVDAGVAQSTSARESICSLTDGVSESSQAATVIHSSSEQQAAGVEEVAGAMANISRAMEQNMTGTAELESAAKKLEELGLSLKELIKQYRI